jgi:maleamate amidohydrolase
LECDSAVSAAAHVLAVAREQARPVVFTTVAYDEADLGTVLMLRKMPRVASLRAGSALTEIDLRLAPSDEELVLAKKHASAFFGTTLLPFLVGNAVDTLLICGVITSGCIRTSAVDAAQFGFRALVVAEATADRSPGAHATGLQVVDDLYGDVISLTEAEDVLRLQ